MISWMSLATLSIRSSISMLAYKTSIRYCQFSASGVKGSNRPWMALHSNTCASGPGNRILLSNWTAFPYVSIRTFGFCMRVSKRFLNVLEILSASCLVKLVWARTVPDEEVNVAVIAINISGTIMALPAIVNSRFIGIFDRCTTTANPIKMGSKTTNNSGCSCSFFLRAEDFITRSRCRLARYRSASGGICSISRVQNCTSFVCSIWLQPNLIQ